MLSYSPKKKIFMLSSLVCYIKGESEMTQIIEC